MGARALKKMGARALKNNGCAPSFFQESTSRTLFLSCPFCICSIVLCLAILQTMSACAPLNNECPCPPRKWVLEPSKRWVLEPSKIMGARPHFFKRAFHELISFMSISQLLTCSLLVCLWTVSACAPLSNGCSASTPKIMGARRALLK